MKIGILQTGRTPEEMRQAHGDYDDLFKRLLADRGFSFETYPVLDGVFPQDVHDADGWLITGSKFGAYEPHDWIPPLEDFLRRAYAADVPIIGVCFGHQILAQALGGRVEKFRGGWAVGAIDYDLDGSDRKETIMAWHQDQITALPEEARVLGRNAFSPHAILAYGNRAFTVQPHPEFSRSFVEDLIEARSDVIPPEVAEQARSRLDAPLTSADFADRLERFFKTREI
ncbi:MAG TPA: glutamine amidotransferase [Rhodobacteraceae bacterium]|nr:glutamine amidotransferase [Paracoccaceae bacterium]